MIARDASRIRPARQDPEIAQAPARLEDEGREGDKLRPKTSVFAGAELFA